MIALNDMTVITVQGDDAQNWLNNLLTSSIADLQLSQAQASALLTPQGKIIWSDLIGQVGDIYYLLVHQSIVAPLQKRLMMYRLRAKIDIESPTGTLFYSQTRPHDGDICFTDARLEGLGHYIWRRGDISDVAEQTADYDQLCQDRGILRQGRDFGDADTFPHDIGLDQLGGIDFEKGCYVGQEVVSRMQHRGGARKRPVIITSDQKIADEFNGAKIIQSEKSIGTVTSINGHGALGILRVDKWDPKTEVMLQTTSDKSLTVTLEYPNWLTVTDNT